MTTQQTTARTYSGKIAEYTPDTCPARGRLMFWHQLDGQHGDAHALYCPKCGVAVRRKPYPEEARQHPGEIEREKS